MAMNEWEPHLMDHDDSIMDQPVTRWHELRNALNAMAVTLAVVSERQAAASEQGKRIETGVVDMEKQLSGLSTRVTSLEQQFTPVRTVVYGLVALMVTGVVGALIALVIR